MNVRTSLLGALTGLCLVLIGAQSARAIPAFARKYKTSCTTCHYAFPKLNAFGKAFLNNGYRYPQGQDPEMRKEEPVSMGSESYKRVWPDAIWPTDMASTVPLAVHLMGKIHYDRDWSDEAMPSERKRNVYFETPAGIHVLAAGTFDDKISFFGEIEFEHESELGYSFLVNYDFDPACHLKLGSVGLMASPEHRKLTSEDYNVDMLENQSGTWNMAEGAGGGAELWGAGNGYKGRGGYTYALGVCNGQNSENNFDLNTHKDLYARLTYKIGGLGEIGGTQGQGGATSAFYEDNSFRLGGLFYSGKALDTGNDLEDKFYIAGGDLDLWYSRLNLNALAISMKSDYSDYKRTSLAYYIEGNYVIYPWLIGEARYEYTDEDTDDDTLDPATSLLPGVVIMIRANVKCSLEYMAPLDEARKNDDRLTFKFDVGL